MRILELISELVMEGRHISYNILVVVHVFIYFVQCAWIRPVCIIGLVMFNLSLSSSVFEQKYGNLSSKYRK